MDWSHQHVIFSQPSTDAQAAAVMHEPRYWQQFNREHFTRTLNAGQLDLNTGMFANASGSRGDWSQNLGSGANAGAGVYPAKYSFLATTANCGNATRPDTVVFSTGLAGSATQASIVAFDNLYSGCGGTVPQVYWAYDTAGTILTSPIHSEDGTQVAFVQTVGGVASLVLLKWTPGGTIGSPVNPTILTNTSLSLYRGCTAPCMARLPLVTGTGPAMDDTTSSVFPDYGQDVIWVGGALGWLNKFTGVFRSTPARAPAADGFPVQVNSTLLTSSPVYDSVSNSVFIGDASGLLERVSLTGTGTVMSVTKSGQLDFGAGVVASPVVDSTAGTVYVFASSDLTNAAVYQFPTNFPSFSTGTKITVGVSSAAPNPLYIGAFDGSYFGSAAPRTGNLYVCGNTGGAPTLYRIPITAGTMGTAVAGPALSSANTGCSPVTDVPNPNAAGGAQEWIFASAQASGLGNLCGGGGCAMNFVDTPWQPSHAYTAGQQVLDTNFNVQTCRQAGNSRTAALGHPVWNTTPGANTNDATVRWVNQGPQVAAHGAWQASHVYATVGIAIIDTNGNVQVVTTTGTSRTAALGHPNWSPTINVVTADASVRWRNVGLPATSSLAAAGGTGGIIVDNVVGSGTLAGASQIYFSTQNNQVCGTTGTGGCAVQASQSALN